MVIIRFTLFLSQQKHAIEKKFFYVLRQIYKICKLFIQQSFSGSFCPSTFSVSSLYIIIFFLFWPQCMYMGGKYPNRTKGYGMKTKYLTIPSTVSLNFTPWGEPLLREFINFNSYGGYQYICKYQFIPHLVIQFQTLGKMRNLKHIAPPPLITSTFCYFIYMLHSFWKLELSL